jgi:Patatin-like phospholipase
VLNRPLHLCEVLEDEHLALYGEDWRVTPADILDPVAIAQRCGAVFEGMFRVPVRHEVDRRGEITEVVKNLNALIERDTALVQNLFEDVADVRQRNRRILESISGDALAKGGERGWEVRPAQVRDAAGLARQWRRAAEPVKKQKPNRIEEQWDTVVRTLEKKLPESIAKHIQSDEAEEQLPEWLCNAASKSPAESRRQIAKGLNDLIHGENLVTEVYPNLLKQIAVTTRQLLDQSEDLTPQERAYLNRRIIDDVFGGYIQRGEEARLAKIYEVIHASGETSALCISGGGIRSATFGLGILQGLSRRNLLHKFDYISTVSGGGYIGSWLSSWMRRHGHGARGVAEDLAKPPADKLQTEPKPVEHLREFSNYLTPRLGVLSGDTLAVAAVYVRNLLLNWTILIPLLLAALALPRMVHAIYFRSLSADLSSSLDALAVKIVGASTLATFGLDKLKWLDDAMVRAATWAAERLIALADLIEAGSSFFLIDWMRRLGLFEHTAAWIGGMSLLCAVVYLGKNRPAVNRFGEVRPEKVQQNFMLLCLGPFVVACLALTAAWARMTMAGRDAIPLAGFVIFGAVPLVAGTIYLISYMRATASDRRESVRSSAMGRRSLKKKIWKELVAATAASIVSAVLVWLVAAYVFPSPFDPVTIETYPSPILALHERLPVSAFYVCFAVPLLLGVFLIAATVFVGVSSAVNEDYDREWWARCSGYAIGAIAVWILVTSVVTFGPVALHFAPRAIGAAGGIAGVVAIVLGRGQKTGGQEGKKTTKSDIIAACAAPVFILFLLAVGSLLTSKLFAPEEMIDASSAAMLRSVRWSAQQTSDAPAAAIRMDGFRPRTVGMPGANAVPALGGAKIEVKTAIADRPAFDVARYGAWKHQISVSHSQLPPLAAFVVVLALLARYAARRVNVNKFSLHSLYRNRLIRAYLGASRSTRDPHPFTGFDPQDNIEMQQLRPEMLWASSFRDLSGVISWLTGTVQPKPDERAKQDFSQNLRIKMERVKPDLFDNADRPEFDSELFQVLNCVLDTDDLEKVEERGRRTSLWNVKALIADRKRRGPKPRQAPEAVKTDPRRLRRNREALDRHFAREIYPYDFPLLRRGDVAKYTSLAKTLRQPFVTDTGSKPAPSDTLDWLRTKFQPFRGVLDRCEAKNQHLHAALETIVGELNRLLTECDLATLRDLGPAAYPVDYQRVRRNRQILDRELAGAIHPLSTPRTMHVVNVALNLVAGEKLGWQERKAQSFTITPLHAGGFGVGYRQSTSYGGGITLGTAVTISGAAVSPNMGYHSSAPLAFLLTLFNVRLGWWLGNPGPFGGATWQDDCPKVALRPLMAELSGSTNECFPYVYLSDGGHFENLGLYEMVLRRRRYIMVSDAGCDPTHAFEDLGNAIRKIRTDLGVPIEIQHMCIYPRTAEGEPKVGRYCAVGRIRYSCVDSYGEDGWLLYLKPAVYMTEPQDIYNYAKSSVAFPHEGTADQWFSESQFESYRMLGSHAVDRVCKGADDDCDDVVAQNWIPASFEEFFQTAKLHAEKEVAAAAAEVATSPSAESEQPRSRTRGRSKPGSAPSR